MIRCRVMEEWKAEAQADILLAQLEERFGPSAAQLNDPIRAVTDLDVLKRWGVLVIRTASLDQFRQDAGLPT